LFAGSPKEAQASRSAGSLCASREKKIEQVNRRRKSLLGEIGNLARTYTYEYLCYRITNYRPGSYPSLKLSGGEASHDLHLFVEDLSDAANMWRRPPASGC
jgi:RNA polymerase primary sigma factor